MILNVKQKIFAYIPFDIFYLKFLKFLKKNGIKKDSKKEFGKKLRKLGWEIKRMNYHDENTKEWKLKVSVEGIKMKEEKLIL